MTLRDPKKLFLALALGTWISAAAGCGSSIVDPPVVPVAPVSGSVKFGNEIPVGATVSLVPLVRTEEGIGSSGTVKADGSFKISTYAQEDGAPLGDYVVLVQWFKPLKSDEGNVGGPNVLPKNYSDPAQSPIKVTVKDGPNVIPPIVITR